MPKSKVKSTVEKINTVSVGWSVAIEDSTPEIYGIAAALLDERVAHSKQSTKRLVKGLEQVMEHYQKSTKRLSEPNAITVFGRSYLSKDRKAAVRVLQDEAVWLRSWIASLGATLEKLNDGRRV